MYRALHLPRTGACARSFVRGEGLEWWDGREGGTGVTDHHAASIVGPQLGRVEDFHHGGYVDTWGQVVYIG